MPSRLPRITTLGAIAALVVAGVVAGGVAAGAAQTHDPFLAMSAAKPGKAGAADPSGVPMPKGNLPGWRQVYANDFTVNAAARQLLWVHARAHARQIALRRTSRS